MTVLDSLDGHIPVVGCRLTWSELRAMVRAYEMAAPETLKGGES